MCARPSRDRSSRHVFATPKGPVADPDSGRRAVERLTTKTIYFPSFPNLKAISQERLEDIARLLMSPSQEKRKEWVKGLWGALIQKYKRADLAVAYLVDTYAPTTALTYMRTALAMYPLLRDELKPAIRQLRRRANTAPKKRAPEATPEQIIELAGDLRTPCQKCVLQLWLGAARHCDSLDWIPQFYSKREVIGLFFPTMKNDATGERQFCKWIPCSKRLAHILWSAPTVTYAEFMSFLANSRFPFLTAHSFRNGAIRYLEKVFAMHEVAALTGHAVKHDTVPGITPYWSPDPNSPAAQQCLCVARCLMQAVQLRTL
jgi:hypothetical protein